MAFQKPNISNDIYEYFHYLTCDFLIQSLLTTVQPLLYAHIGFWTFRITIRTNWNNYYNITNVSTALHLSQMKRFSGSHCFFHLFTNSASQQLPITALSVHECKLVCSVFWRVEVGRIYSSIAQNLKFDWSLNITWKRRATGNEICVNKHKYYHKYFSCYILISIVFFPTKVLQNMSS